MNFLNLHYFCVAAEELSFTKAAMRLFISQQSLSNHISRLEAEYGVVLFNRTQPLTLTEAGECLYRNSQILLNQKNQTEKALQDIRDFHSGDLTIGTSTSRGTIMLPDVLPEFNREFPQINLHLVEGTTKQINQALYEGRTDVNIGFAINDPVNICEELLHTEHLVCAVPVPYLDTYLRQEGVLPRPGTPQNFRTFASCPFLKMSHDAWLGGIFERCCQEHNVSPKVVLETTSMSTLVSLCTVGLGAIVLPEIFISRRMVFWNRSDWRESVVIYPLDYSTGNKPITISYLRGHYLSRAALEFMRMAKQKFTY
ncbi:putative LysR family transcriptional regulator [Oscillibacter valericigenes Sjm18-20]|nr:putative LysR family transcriptional regulator [Oscillibacter valericigenes Sjm18-20]